MNMTILIIEDEEGIADLIKQTLSIGGFAFVHVSDGKEALRLLEKDNFDLILLDLMLPEVDGFHILPKAIDRGFPVIILTAKDTLADKVMGLNLGADDYITKPFESIELLARIRVILRRSQKYANHFSVCKFDDITILIDQRKVLKENEEVGLTHKEFELIKVLYENKGIALSREKLLNIVWEYDFEGSTRTVDMHIQKLRDKLKTERIKTIYKFGYRLEI